MGCCSFSPSTVTPGLSLPEPELALIDAECKHPFASVAVQTLFQAFCPTGLPGTMSVEEFKSICDTLGLSRPRLAFLRAVQHPSGRVDERTLLLTAVLLGLGNVETKLKALLQVYGCSQVSKGALCLVLADLSHLATANLAAAEASVEAYLEQLRAIRPAFVGYIACYLQKAVVQGEFDSRLQAMLWATGIRLALIELDLQNQRNEKIKKRSDSIGRCDSVTLHSAISRGSKQSMGLHE